MAPRKPAGKTQSGSGAAPKRGSKSVSAPKSGSANRRRKPVGGAELDAPPQSTGNLRSRSFAEAAEAFNQLTPSERATVLSYIPTSSRQRLQGMLEKEGTFSRQKVLAASERAEAQPRDPQVLYEYDAAKQGLARAIERHRELSAAAPAKPAPEPQQDAIDFDTSAADEGLVTEDVMRGLTRNAMAREGLDARHPDVVESQAVQARTLGAKFKPKDEAVTEFLIRAGKEADAEPDTAIAPVLSALQGLSASDRAAILDSLALAGGADADKVASGKMLDVEKMQYIPSSLHAGFALPQAGTLKEGLGGLREGGDKAGSPATARKVRAAQKAAAPERTISNDLAQLENLTTHAGWQVAREVDQPESRSVADRASEWDESDLSSNDDKVRDAAATGREVLIRKMMPELGRMIAWQDKEHFGWDHKSGLGSTEAVYEGASSGTPQDVALYEGEQLPDTTSVRVSGVVHPADKVAKALFEQDIRDGKVDMDALKASRSAGWPSAEEQAYGLMAEKVKRLEAAHRANPTKDSLKAVNAAMNGMLNQLSIDTRAAIGAPEHVTNPRMTGPQQQRALFEAEKPFISKREAVLRQLSDRAGLVNFSGVAGGNMDALSGRNATVSDYDGTPVEIDDQSGVPVEQSGRVANEGVERPGAKRALAGLTDEEGIIDEGGTVNLDQIAPFWRANFPTVNPDGTVTYDNKPPSARLLAGLISNIYGADPDDWGDIDEFGRPISSAVATRYAEGITPLIERSIAKYKDQPPRQYAGVGKWVGRNLEPGSDASKAFLQELMQDLTALDAIDYPLRSDEADLSWQPEYQAALENRKAERRNSRSGRNVQQYDANEDADIDLDGSMGDDDSDIDLGESSDFVETPSQTARPVEQEMEEDIDLGHSSDEPDYDQMDQNEYWSNSGDEDIDLSYNGGYLPVMPMNRMRMGNTALAGLIA